MENSEPVRGKTVINVCGRRILDCVADCLAKFNRGADIVTLQTFSGSENTGVEIAHLMKEGFGIEVSPTIELKEVKINDFKTPSLEIPLKGEATQFVNVKSKPSPEELAIQSIIQETYKEDIWSTKVVRTSDGYAVTIFSPRPWVMKIKEMKDTLENNVSGKIYLNVEEVTEPKPDAYLINYYSSRQWFVEFIVYDLLLDSLLVEKGELDIYNNENEGTLLLLVPKSDFSYIYHTKISEENKEMLNYLTSAYYRCGLLLSPSWHSVAYKLSHYDDIILGIDTNILHKCYTH